MYQNTLSAAAPPEPRWRSLRRSPDPLGSWGHSSPFPSPRRLRHLDLAVFRASLLTSPSPLIPHCYTKLYELDSVASVWTETYELVDWTTRRGRHSVVVRALLVPVPALYFLVLLRCTHTSHQSQLNRYLHKPGSRQVAILALKLRTTVA